MTGKRWFGPQPNKNLLALPTPHGSCGCCGCGYYSELGPYPGDSPGTAFPATRHGELLDSDNEPLGCPDTIVWPFPFTNQAIQFTDESSRLKIYKRFESPVLKLTITDLPTVLSKPFDFSTHATLGWDTLNGVYEYPLPQSQFGCLMPFLPPDNPTCTAGSFGGQPKDIAESYTIPNALTINGSPPIGDDSLYLKVYPVVSRRGPFLDSVQVVVSAMINLSFSTNHMPVIRANTATGDGWVDNTRLVGNANGIVVETILYRTGWNIRTPVEVELKDACFSAVGCGATGDYAGTLRMEIFDDV